MKVLTLTQPWATLVAIGAKHIETRSWSTRYRGTLAIHASARIPKSARELCDQEPFRSALLNVFLADGEMPLGCVLAICELGGCVKIPKHPGLLPYKHTSERLFEIALPPDEPELSFGDYTPGRYAWILTNIRALDVPIPAKGALGLWEWTKEDW